MRLERRKNENGKPEWVEKGTDNKFKGHVMKDLNTGDKAEFTENGKTIVREVKSKRKENGITIMRVSESEV